MKTRLICSFLVLVSTSAVAQTLSDTDLQKKVITESIRNRESAEHAIVHCLVDVDVVGPSTTLMVPTDAQGNTYRQKTTQDWWANDQSIGVATHVKCQSWLDGKQILSRDDQINPRNVQVFDGERAYSLDFRPDGTTLEINSRWPYFGVSTPPLFGRAYTNLPYSECLARGFSIVRTETLHEHVCTLVQFAWGNGRVLAWLASDLNWLCIREEYYGENGSRTLSREFMFDETNPSYPIPKTGVEVFLSPHNDEVTTTWTFLAFEKNPTLPIYVFTPSNDDAVTVIDRSTGQVLKAPK